LGRNQYIAEMADNIVFGYINESSSLMRLYNEFASKSILLKPKDSDKTLNLNNTFRKPFSRARLACEKSPLGVSTPRLGVFTPRLGVDTPSNPVARGFNKNGTVPETFENAAGTVPHHSFFAPPASKRKTPAMHRLRRPAPPRPPRPHPTAPTHGGTAQGSGKRAQREQSRATV